MRESRSSGSVGGEGATSSPTRHPYATWGRASFRGAKERSKVRNALNGESTLIEETSSRPLAGPADIRTRGPTRSDDLDQHCLRQLSRQMLDEGAHRRQQSLPVRGERGER